MIVKGKPMCRLAFGMAMLVAVTIVIAAAPARAGDLGFFIEPEAGAVFRFGTSHTNHGGASFAGGATVHDVEFDTAYQIGGDVGYRFSSDLAVFVSYNYISGDVSWRASYAVVSPDSQFEGDAISHVAMANVAYTPWHDSATAFDMTLGVGVSINELNNIKEMNSGLKMSLQNGTKVSPAARAGISLRHDVASWLQLGANAAVTYYGGFRTGDQRNTPILNDISPYGIDPVWGVSVGAFVRAIF